MPKCKSCNASLLRTDAFCGKCGEPVPGAKPVVPLSRQGKPSGVHDAPDPVRMFSSSGSAASARAIAAIALSEPEVAEPSDTDPGRTAVRDRQPSEPAPVVPLRRKKSGAASESRDRSQDEEQTEAAPEEPAPERTKSLANLRIPPGPPILASDLLREQMRPSAPGDRMVRIVTVALSTLGAVGALMTGGMHPLTFVSLALLTVMVTLAATPMSYGGRAMSLFLTGSIATGVALWQQTLHAIAPEGIILAGATILLSGSLLFRAYYRGARLARIAVTCGVLALATWFVVSRGHESLIMLEGHWQSWAPAVTHMTFGLLALLSLLAFMESSTRGGSHVWAVALLALYALHIGLLVAGELWPLEGVHPSLGGPALAAILTGMVGTIVAGVALAQVLVVVYQAASNRIKERF
ncbi:MAG: hypothetical protein AMJ62_03665 [Myxococcales bacterium SG8_38]|nr:MAG: hypothetical protein AMJ62_03665 [Myxococcales bacterium SG8_38]